MNKPVTVYIALGANLDPEDNILRALLLLRQEVELTKLSTFYRTEPIHGAGQPFYLNGVAEATYPHNISVLKFQVLRPIEEQLGRDRKGPRYAARTIDLDILLFGSAVIQEGSISVPDPDLRSRPFLAAAVLELAPDLVLPDTKERLRDVMDADSAGRLTPAVEFSRRAKETLHP